MLELGAGQLFGALEMEEAPQLLSILRRTFFWWAKELEPSAEPYLYHHKLGPWPHLQMILIIHKQFLGSYARYLDSKI